ncbi:unnamed protein product [Clonostachys rhizophaga]|uniref:F-box domain-containing protein n=1 Tax=Clonostachys rhizophaga TaxID=160324 RepID=A0A9N9YX13_9HYPO|nr:unnamed protein product [Clonostachys rhizophaga]
MSSTLTLPADILLLVFDALVGDTTTLVSAACVSSLWRTLSLPFLLKDVDLSSHNRGRLPEYEDPTFALSRVVMSDYSDRYRPRSLVPRQRAFLRLIIDRPELAMHVKIFTWTLVWHDTDEFSCDGDEMTDIDFRTWEVFGRLCSVTHLDLASLHQIGYEPYIQQNPDTLFPAVTHLRLVGWMSRRLVRAIVNSLDASKLVSARFDYLQDEGALPNGKPIPQDLVWKTRDSRYPHDLYNHQGISDELWNRQERGEVAIFPGPMWLPLRILGRRRMSSMAHLQLSLSPFDDQADLRNDITTFIETAAFIRSAKDTLKSISITLGEATYLFPTEEDLRSMCGTSRVNLSNVYQPMCFDLTSSFLRLLLTALNGESFPHLTQVDLKGFRIIQTGAPGRPVDRSTDLTWQYIRDCPFVDEDFTKTDNTDCRQAFSGYDIYLSLEDLDELEQSLDLL